MAASTPVIRAMIFFVWEIASATSRKEVNCGKSNSESFAAKMTFAESLTPSKKAFLRVSGSRSRVESMSNSETFSTASMDDKTGVILPTRVRASFCLAARSLAASRSLCFVRASLARFSKGVSSCG